MRIRDIPDKFAYKSDNTFFRFYDLCNGSNENPNDYAIVKFSRDWKGVKEISRYLLLKKKFQELEDHLPEVYGYTNIIIVKESYNLFIGLVMKFYHQANESTSIDKVLSSSTYKTFLGQSSSLWELEDLTRRVEWQILNILDHFHSLGVVKGDMKRPNFVIDLDKKLVKIIDFYTVLNNVHKSRKLGRKVTKYEEEEEKLASRINEYSELTNLHPNEKYKSKMVSKKEDVYGFMLAIARENYISCEKPSLNGEYIACENTFFSLYFTDFSSICHKKELTMDDLRKPELCINSVRYAYFMTIANYHTRFRVRRGSVESESYLWWRHQIKEYVNRNIRKDFRKFSRKRKNEVKILKKMKRSWIGCVEERATVSRIEKGHGQI